jgi:hypothetical protein
MQNEELFRVIEYGAMSAVSIVTRDSADSIQGGF